MKSQKQKVVSPLSLSSFNEYDQKIFQQFLQNYCQMVQKKDKANLDKQRKVNFFMEDQQQNNKSQSNIFNNNLSFPSINLFEYKEIQPFTGVGSLKQIDLKQILSFQQIKQQDESDKCKIQHSNKTIQNGAMIDESKDEYQITNFYLFLRNGIILQELLIKQLMMQNIFLQTISQRVLKRFSDHQTKIISNFTKYQEPCFLGSSSRQARLREIVLCANVIKEELENALNYFTKNVSQ